MKNPLNRIRKEFNISNSVLSTVLKCQESDLTGYQKKTISTQKRAALNKKLKSFAKNYRVWKKTGRVGDVSPSKRVV
jgi:hypothetical protein